MGDCRVCNGEYKCELSGANKRLVPDHIDRRVESGSSSWSQKGSHLQGGVDRTGDPILTSEVFHVMHVILSLKLGDH